MSERSAWLQCKQLSADVVMSVKIQEGVIRSVCLFQNRHNS